MKWTSSTYNPLQEVLNVFPMETNEHMTLVQMDRVQSLLDQGGVHCEDLDEILESLKVLADMGLLDIKPYIKKNATYFKITRKYNG